MIIMKKILYIQPYDRPWIDKTSILSRKKACISRVPYELGTFLHEVEEFDILDLNLELKFLEVEVVISERLNSFKPDIVFISMPTFTVADQVKRIAGCIPTTIRTVLGGSSLGLIKDWPVRNGYQVHTCYDGWGHELPEILDSSMSTTYIHGTRNSIADDYEPEAFYTINGTFNFSQLLARYKHQSIIPSGILEMSRGCMFGCSFCALNKDRMGLFTRKPLTVYKEAEYLAKNGIEYFHIIDPTFGLAKSETEELIAYLTQLKGSYPAIAFEVLTRPELITKEFAQKLKSMGVVRCGIGMETMSEDQLKEVSKTVRTNKTSRAVYTLAEQGIQTKLFHMLFYKKLSVETIQFVLQLSKDKVPFIVQSSFNRPLSNPSSTNPIQYDQTVFHPIWDTHEELLEYLLINLAFPSMDVGNSMEHQAELQTILSRMISNGDDLKFLAEFNSENNFLTLNTGTGGYNYKHQDLLPVHRLIYLKT